MENLQGKKYCFAGNRFFVLSEMLKAGLDVKAIFAIKGSYLERELTNRQIPYEVIENKKWLVERLMALDFDYFVSNGLPIILPIARLTAGNDKQFINIHPSFLPDLRGIDPVPGSLLLGKPSGATCHYMNDEIDGGAIIEQVLIPYTTDMDCGLLYQLSFLAEGEVFAKALRSGFGNKIEQVTKGDEVYYNLREADKVLDFSKDAAHIARQVRAFNTRSQGAYFLFEGAKIVIRDVEIVTNAYAVDKTRHLQENQVAFVYENTILLKKDGCCVKLKPAELLPATLKAGCLLQGF